MVLNLKLYIYLKCSCCRRIFWFFNDVTYPQISQLQNQHQLETLTSSLKRSWRLMSERRRHCFSSCSNSESGCLKYSIRSFSVWSTSSTYPATAVDSPSAVLSKALEGRTRETKKDKRKKKDQAVKTWNSEHYHYAGVLSCRIWQDTCPCSYLMKLVNRSVVLRMMRAARDSSCWQRWRISPSSMWPSECKQA